MWNAQLVPAKMHLMPEELLGVEISWSEYEILENLRLVQVLDLIYIGARIPLKFPRNVDGNSDNGTIVLSI